MTETNETNIKPNKRASYLAMVALFTMAFGALVLSIGLAFDPFGVSPTRVNIPGINTPRVARTELDRLIKPLDVINRKPKTVLIGTSRVKEGFDPDDWRDTRFWPVYNLGIDFSSPTESLALLELLLPLVPEIETAIIEINFIHFYRPGPVRLPGDTLALIETLPEVFFSWSMLDASLKTVVRNQGFEGSTFWLREDGQADVAKGSMLDDMSNFLTNVVSPQSRTSIASDLSSQERLFNRITAACAKHEVECIFVVLPYQPLDLAHQYLGGRWPRLEDVKRFFSNRTGVYSFAMFDRFATEPYQPRMTNWYDVNHFTPRVGRYIAKVLDGDPIADTPSGFGTLVNEDNLDSVLKEWARRRDLWLAAHPDMVASIEQSLGPPLAAPR